MKFAHQLKEALQQEGFPPHWVESAVPYGKLKKCIKKVQRELNSFGLDAETLRHLLPPTSDSGAQVPARGVGDSPVTFQYQFAEDNQALRPKLVLFVTLEDGVAVDARLSPATRRQLVALANGQINLSAVNAADHQAALDEQSSILATTDICEQDGKGSLPTTNLDCASTREIEIPLTFDAEFFGLLRGDVSQLDTLQAREEKALTDEIVELGREVTKVTNPNRSRQHDLDRWRELFDLYLQAGVFFSTTELDRGSRESSVARMQLQWFDSEVQGRGLVKAFRLPASRNAFVRFMNVNLALLRSLKFQEINQLAITKILKKFDKRTSLGAKETFPKLIQSRRIMSETMAKAVCAEISSEIVKVVPQLDDYLCPVCFTVSYKPIRLKCNHVFCIRCMIKMQQSKTKFCPLCRNNVVLDADSANLDTSLMNFLQVYFPKETKAKQRENEVAIAIDRWGEDYANAKCQVM